MLHIVAPVVGIDQTCKAKSIFSDGSIKPFFGALNPADMIEPVSPLCLAAQRQHAQEETKAGKGVHPSISEHSKRIHAEQNLIA